MQAIYLPDISLSVLIAEAAGVHACHLAAISLCNLSASSDHRLRRDSPSPLPQAGVTLGIPPASGVRSRYLSIVSWTS